MATEQEAVPAILDLMTGRWRSEVLHAGVALGIYDALSASQALPLAHPGKRGGRGGPGADTASSAIIRTNNRAFRWTLCQIR